jgi:hypothetical protein
MHIRKRAIATATAVLLTAGATGVALAPTASANSAAGSIYVDGGGYVGDDWNDEYNIGVDDYASGNAAALWETVLYADGAKWQDDDGNDHTFRKNDIDGSFGERTESATQWWQQHEGLSDTEGVVTDESWSYAGQYLGGPSGSTVSYNGYKHDVTFKRISGKYRVKLHGAWKIAYYDRLG